MTRQGRELYVERHRARIAAGREPGSEHHHDRPRDRRETGEQGAGEIEPGAGDVEYQHETEERDDQRRDQPAGQPLLADRARQQADHQREDVEDDHRQPDRDAVERGVERVRLDGLRRADRERDHHCARRQAGGRAGYQKQGVEDEAATEKPDDDDGRRIGAALKRDDCRDRRRRQHHRSEQTQPDTDPLPIGVHDRRAITSDGREMSRLVGDGSFRNEAIIQPLARAIEPRVPMGIDTGTNCPLPSWACRTERVGEADAGSVAQRPLGAATTAKVARGARWVAP